MQCKAWQVALKSRTLSRGPSHLHLTCCFDFDLTSSISQSSSFDILCRLPTDEAWEQSEAISCVPCPSSHPAPGQLPRFKVAGAVEVKVGASFSHCNAIAAELYHKAYLLMRQELSMLVLSLRSNPPCLCLILVIVDHANQQLACCSIHLCCPSTSFKDLHLSYLASGYTHITSVNACCIKASSCWPHSPWMRYVLVQQLGLSLSSKSQHGLLDHSCALG